MKWVEYQLFIKGRTHKGSSIKLKGHLFQGIFVVLYIRTSFFAVKRVDESNLMVSPLPIVTMARSVKLFQFVQKFHRAIGIHTSPSNQQQHSIISRKTISLISFVQFALTTVGFLAFDAKSMFDYGFALFTSICVINGIVIYVLFVCEAENTVNFIRNCEAFIEKSKCCRRTYTICLRHRQFNCMHYCVRSTGVHSTIAYSEFIGKFERFNEYFCVSLFVSIAFCVISALPYTLVRYLLYDMGEDSFYLFVPAWFVFTQ